MTAEQVLGLIESKGIEKATKEVDVVTTGTFGAMCSSGAFLNFGHSEPPIKMQHVSLNGVGGVRRAGGGRRLHRRHRAAQRQGHELRRCACHRGTGGRKGGPPQGELVLHRLLPAEGHRHLHLAQDHQPGLPVQSRATPTRTTDWPPTAPTRRCTPTWASCCRIRQRHLLLRRTALAPAERPSDEDHRHRHQDIPGRRRRLRRLGRHPVQDHHADQERRPGGRGPFAGVDRRPARHVHRVRPGAELPEVRAVARPRHRRPDPDTGRGDDEVRLDPGRPDIRAAARLLGAVPYPQTDEGDQLRRPAFRQHRAATGSRSRPPRSPATTRPGSSPDV